MIDDCTDHPDSLPGPHTMRFEIGMWMRIHRLGDPDSAYEFLGNWLRRTSHLTSVYLDQVTSLSQHFVTGVAVRAALAKEDNDPQFLVSPHDDLEKFFGGPVDDVVAVQSLIEDSDSGFAAALSPKGAEIELRPALTKVLATPIHEGRVPDPFLLMEEISAQMRDGDRNYVTNSFLGLLLCAAYAGVIGTHEPMIIMGGSSRLSLANLPTRLVGLDGSSMGEAFQYALEALAISQHFATAVNRFDGQNQRLRLTVEETGLEALVSKPWGLSVTEDRLPSLLSLAAQSGLLIRTKDSRFAPNPI